MANDGEINISTKVDTSGLDKGLQNVKSKVNSTSKSLNKGSKAVQGLKTAFSETGGAAAGFAGKMADVAAKGGVVAVGITTAVVAAKKYIQAIKQTSDAYKVQAKAESALEKAVANNPYLTSESVQSLKDYAGALQSVSNYGDESTIVIMAQLAAMGRTEEQIKAIMSAAADMSATTGNSLQSVAMQLSKTYSGLAGELGEANSAIRELTQEELKSGKAIEVVAQQYKGAAKAAVDVSTQAKNAKGDFMEALGQLTTPSVTAWDNFWKNFYEKGVKRINAINNLLETASRKWGGDKRAVSEGVGIVNTTYTDNQTGATKDGAQLQTTEYLKWLEKELQLKKNLTAEESQALIYVSTELKHRERVAKYETEETEKERQRTEELNKQNAAHQTADDYARASNEALEENLRALEVEAKAKGESVSAQDRYNVYLQSYIDLLTKTAGTIQEGYPVEQKRLEQLQAAKKALDEATDAEQKYAATVQLTQATTEAINSIKQELTPAEELQKQIDALEEMKQKLQETSEEEIVAAQENEETQLSKQELIEGVSAAEKQIIDEKISAVTESEGSWWDKYASKQQELLDLKKAVDESEVLSEEEKCERMKELDEAYKQSKMAQLNELMTQVSSYTSQSVDIINQASDLMLEASKNNAVAEQAELEAKYRKGEISEEEYNKALTESKKKAAKEQYKIQMVQWSASVLQATANIAQGVTAAMAQSYPAGLIAGTLVAAAGAVQLASIIASKPTPPKFANGGFIGGMNGATMGADNTYIHARTGELVANAAQQRNLWEAMNGGASGRGGANIVINNSASNIATAQPRITRDKIEIMIDARVNDSLKNGRYNTSLNMAQQGMSGEYYGI